MSKKKTEPSFHDYSFSEDDFEREQVEAAIARAKSQSIADHVRAKIANEKPIPLWPTDPRTVTVPILGWVR